MTTTSTSLGTFSRRLIGTSSRRMEIRSSNGRLRNAPKTKIIRCSRKITMIRLSYNIQCVNLSHIIEVCDPGAILDSCLRFPYHAYGAINSTLRARSALRAVFVRNFTIKEYVNVPVISRPYSSCLEWNLSN